MQMQLKHNDMHEERGSGLAFIQLNGNCRQERIINMQFKHSTLILLSYKTVLRRNTISPISPDPRFPPQQLKVTFN